MSMWDKVLMYNFYKVQREKAQIKTSINAAGRLRPRPIDSEGLDFEL